MKCKCSVTWVLVALALVYLSYNLYTVYAIFNPPKCKPNQKKNCLTPAYPSSNKLQVG